eukprot:TRINITY_DN1696_c0_g1_i6.p1 TRINITY_DN1696_c0_g1~~TRINITY_DN1696_c0_g1_i6.p1  ORF type:complete len:112 (+),score=7.09 TRINITY_DN1696_c0_g1_i6:32-367(+)
MAAVKAERRGGTPSSSDCTTILLSIRPTLSTSPRLAYIRSTSKKRKMIKGGSSEPVGGEGDPQRSLGHAIFPPCRAESFRCSVARLTLCLPHYPPRHTTIRRCAAEGSTLG